MPAHSVVRKERRLILTVYEGRLTFDELKSNQERILSDPDFNPDFDQFIDATTVTFLDFSVDETKMLVTRKIFSPTSRRAMAASNAAVYGLARMSAVYSQMATGHHEDRLAVFYSRDEALKWLGVSQDSGLY